MPRIANRNRIRHTPIERVWTVLLYTVVVIISLLIILPCLNVLSLSFNDGWDAARGGVWFLPRKFSLDNYKRIFTEGKLLPAYKITILRTVIGTLFTLIVTSMAAFALRERDLPGRKAIIFFITFTMLFGGGTVPTYITYKELGLLDNFMVYVIPGMVSVTFLMMMRSNFESIPDSLYESAKLDGASYPVIYLKVVMPLSKAILAVIGLYRAVGHWNDWYSGAFYMTSDRLWPVQTHLQQLLKDANMEREITSVSQALAANRSGSTSNSLQMAAVIFTVLPILFVYPFIQKYFAKGTMTGAIKG